MQHRRWLSLLCGTLLLAACSQVGGPSSSSARAEPVSSPASPTTLTTTPSEQGMPPDFGTTTYRDTGNIENVEARQQFLNAYREGKPGRWEEIFFTDEGDPISAQLHYKGDGTALRLVYDTTQDKFGSKQVVEYACETLVEEVTQLRMRCSAGGQQVHIALP